MKSNRRDFLRTTGLGLGALGLATTAAFSAAKPNLSFAAPSKIRLGTVTYNLAKDWDLATIIRNCQDAAFEGVELRTTHAHGVEVTLNKAQREEVKQRFRDSNVELMGLGSAFDYHTPDQTKLRKDIEATKEYIVLAHDVGASGVKVRPNGCLTKCQKKRRWSKSAGRCANWASSAMVTACKSGLKSTARRPRCCQTSKPSWMRPTIGT